MAEQIRDLEVLQIPSGWARPLTWVFLVISAIGLSLVLWAWGRPTALIPALLVAALVGPFYILRRVKDWAIKVYNVQIINPASPDGFMEAELHELVWAISHRAGLEWMPDVGLYESDEINAFSVGGCRDDALVAVSTGLLRKLDAAEAAAVVAHEIAHVANGDMVTMALVQGAVQSIAAMAILPVQLVGRLFSSWKPAKVAFGLLVRAIRWLVTNIVLLLANLVVLKFSRDREFQADWAAAHLVGPDRVLHALETLAAEDAKPSANSAKQYLAALKISAPPSWCGEIFSTHPSFTRRISKLQTQIEITGLGRPRH